MEIDPRGPRLAAAITCVVLAVVLLTSSGVLLALQALVFAIGAIAGLRYAPYGALYRVLIRPRLGPPASTEPEAPPRFAQGVGMVFTIVGAVGYLTGLTALGIVFTALALAAAFANAVFDYCLGCQMYLYIQRVRPSHGRL